MSISFQNEMKTLTSQMEHCQGNIKSIESRLCSIEHLLCHLNRKSVVGEITWVDYFKDGPRHQTIQLNPDGRCMGLNGGWCEHASTWTWKMEGDDTISIGPLKNKQGNPMIHRMKYIKQLEDGKCLWRMTHLNGKYNNNMRVRKMITH